MGAVSAEVEELQRGKKRGRSIKQHDLHHGNTDHEPVDPNHRVHENQRLHAEIAFEERPIPIAEMARVILVKIGIALVPCQPVMGVVRVS